MADDGAPAGGSGHLDRVPSLGQGADLVELDEDRVRRLLADGARQALRVRHQQVVTHHLDAATQLRGEGRPARPVVLGQAVLQAHDRVAVRPVAPEGDQLVAREGALLTGEDVSALAVDLRRRGVERDRDLLARPIARALDRLEDEPDGRLVRAETRRVSALVAHRRGEAALVEKRAERVEGLGRPAQRLGKGRGSQGRDHELLKVGRVHRVLAAVEDVHQRDRQDVGRVTPQVPIQRQPFRRGCGMGGCQRDAEQRVGAKAALVRRPVKHDQQTVEARLVKRVEACHRLGDLGVHVRDRVQHPLPAVARLVAVAQLDRLVGTGGRAGGNYRATPSPAGKAHLDLDRGVAARIKDLAPVDGGDRRAHRSGRASTPGSFLPSTNSSEAPPPVETWLI